MFITEVLLEVESVYIANSNGHHLVFIFNKMLLQGTKDKTWEAIIEFSKVYNDDFKSNEKFHFRSNQ